MKRRDFLALTAASTFFPRVVLSEAAKPPVTVVVFLRGAMDGLSFLPPLDDPEYAFLRPSIALAKDCKLHEGFGLHPSLANLRKLFQNGEASFLFEAGSPALTRSHFDAQDWMEAGAISLPSETSGFLGRLSARRPQSALSTVAVQSGLPRLLKGASNGLAFTDFRSLKLKGPLTRDGLEGRKEETIDPAVEKLYGQASDPFFRRAAQSFLQGSQVVDRAAALFESEKSQLPKGPLAKDLAQISALIRTQVGVEFAVTEMGGWDTHVNQGNGEKGSLKDRFAEFDSALSSFWSSLGKEKDRVCVAVITEFGRTAHENGDRGTDHGHGSVFTVLGTRLKPQRIFHQFKSLAKADLNEGRDLHVRFDYRQIFSEILTKHASVNMNHIFPGFQPGAEIGLFKTT